MNKFNDKDRKQFLDSLPRKRIAAGVLLFNEDEELLMVKPSYKDHWSIPGGTVDEFESPRTAAIRETEEEIGIKLEDVRLTGLVYVNDTKFRDESLQMVFTGGTLNDEQIKNIEIDDQEIIDYKFVELESVKDYNRDIGENIQKYREAIKNTIVYFDIER